MAPWPELSAGSLVVPGMHTARPSQVFEPVTWMGEGTSSVVEILLGEKADVEFTRGAQDMETTCRAFGGGMDKGAVVRS